MCFFKSTTLSLNDQGLNFKMGARLSVNNTDDALYHRSQPTYYQDITQVRRRGQKLINRTPPWPSCYETAWNCEAQLFKYCLKGCYTENGWSLLLWRCLDQGLWVWILIFFWATLLPPETHTYSSPTVQLRVCVCAWACACVCVPVCACACARVCVWMH